MTKKLLSVFMILPLVLTAGSLAGTAADAPQYDDAELVFILGFMDQGAYTPEKPVTRRELATAALTLINAPAVSEKIYFTDVGADDSAINTAAELGIVNGYNHQFNPDDAATLPQALKIFNNILGYTFQEQQSGGYPGGCRVVAQRLGLTRGVTETDSLKQADLLRLIRNALEVDIMLQYQYGETVSYASEKGRTIVTEYHGYDIGKAEGVVTQNRYSGLTDGSAAARPLIRIDGEAYLCPLAEADGLLGVRVRAYYKIEDEEKTIIWLAPVKTPESVTISADELISFETGTLTAGGNGRGRTYKLAPGLIVLYNGESLPNFTADDILVPYGEVTLMDTALSGVYDVAVVSGWQNCVVSGVNKDKSIVYDKNGGVFELEQTNGRIVELRGADGETADFSAIKQDAVITFMVSKNGQVVRGVISNQTISNKVDEVSNIETARGTLREIKIGETLYTAANNLKKGVYVGMDAVFRLDMNGRIADFSLRAGSLRAGLITGAAQKPGISGTVIVRLFTASGEWETRSLEQKVEIDGIVTRDSAAIAAALNKRQPVGYSLNTAGEINKIDTPTMSAEENDDENIITDYEFNALATMRYKLTGRTFGNKVNIDDEGTIFLLPAEENKADEDRYSVVGTAFFSNDLYYSVGGYSFGKGRVISDIVVAQEIEREPDLNTQWLIVDKITKVSNGDGAEVSKIYGYENGKYVEYTTLPETAVVTTDGKQIIRGDVIRVARDSKDRVTMVETIYTWKDKTRYFTPNPSAEAFDANIRFAEGFVYLRDGYNCRVVMKDSVTEPILATDLWENYNLNLFKLYICTAEGGEISTIVKATYNDVLDYVHNGADCSRFILHTRASVPQTMVIYR
ncbi:MAG: S-layer homology domain-containing protein [Clostridiales bacterium]|jgi:hypothetical protein|nr:S-layer homology domain-containing protein [Clostridiales bacterium]